MAFLELHVSASFNADEMDLELCSWVATTEKLIILLVSSPDPCYTGKGLVHCVQILGCA